MSPLIIYAATLARANKWRQANVISTGRSPLYASPETPNVFRGLRGMTIIIVGHPPILDEINYCEGRNNIVTVKED